MAKKIRYSKKRFGHHQKHTTHFLETYHPYVPVLLTVLLLLVFSFAGFKQSEVALGGVGYVALRHGLTRKQAKAQGRKFALKHPVFDLILVLLVGVCLQLLRSARG